MMLLRHSDEVLHFKLQNDVFYHVQRFFFRVIGSQYHVIPINKHEFFRNAGGLSLLGRDLRYSFKSVAFPEHPKRNIIVSDDIEVEEVGNRKGHYRNFVCDCLTY